MAYNGLHDDQLGFSTSQLPQSLQGCPGCKGTKPNLLGLMSGSKSFTGSNAEVSYQFTHLTVQEFLAAWYAAIVLSAKEQSKLFIEKAGVYRFRMMLLFLAGITGMQDTQVYQQILLNSYHQLQEQLLLKKLQQLQQLQQEEEELEMHKLQLQQELQQLREQQLQCMELQQVQTDIAQQSQLAKLAEGLKENFFLFHLIYESQNTSLSSILANSVHLDGKLELMFLYYDMFELTVFAYFLCTCYFPWKHLTLRDLTDEKMEVIYRVCCEHAGSSDVRGAQNTNPAKPPPFLKDTQELSLQYEFFGDTTPPPKPTSFSYIYKMKLISLSLTFVNVATCTKYVSILLNVLKHHKTLQKLRIVMVQGCAFDIKECEDLLGMMKTNTSLQYLEIGSSYLSDLTVEHIAAGLVHNHSLKELDISNSITSVGGASIFRALVSNTTLESLNMWGNKLQSTPNSPSLQISSSNTSSLSSPSQLLAQPTAALSTTNCQTLSPSPTPHDGGVGAAMANMLSHNSTLTELNVSSCGLTPQSCVPLFKALTQNSSLMKLDISFTTLNDKAALEALADMLSHNSTLTELNVSSCDLTPQSYMSMFIALKHNTSLKKLDMTGNAIGQTASEALADMLSHNSTLTELSILRCGLTPQSCVSVLNALKRNSSLKKLRMGNGNWHINFSNKKINTFDEEASEVLADMLSCNYSLTELEINMCGCQPKALARGLLHNNTLTKVSAFFPNEKHSIMAALEDLRREEGHTQQPDPEVVRCKQVLGF